MKAIVISRPGPADVLEIQTRPDPAPGCHEMLVRVAATALNRADLLQRLGKYPPPPGTQPDIPGLEFSGTVLRSFEDCRFQPGDRVMGLLPGEGYAELVRVSPLLCMPIPEELDFIQAAAVPETFLTAYDALFRQLRMGIGDNLLIHAAGSGVGLAALQLATQAGITTLGTAGSTEKLERAGRCGLKVAINYKRQDFAKIVSESTSGRGVDAIMDLVGASYWESNLASLRPGGRLLLVGLLGGSSTRIDLGTVLSRRLQIIGTALRPRSLQEKADLVRDFEDHMLPALATGTIKPVIDRTFKLEEAAQAHSVMEANSNCGKIILEVG